MSAVRAPADQQALTLPVQPVGRSESPFDAALRAVAVGGSSRLRAHYGGGSWLLPVEHWYADADPTDRVALERLSAQLPPGADVLDVGCGPGRHAAALHQQGHRALGVDTSPVAVDLARRRGAAALQTDALGPLPGADHGWDAVLLLDGNIGIGGDPWLLLCRVRDLLRPTGRVLLELNRAGCSDRGLARLTRDRQISRAFPWARLDERGLTRIVACAGLDLCDVWTEQGRRFALLAAGAG